MQQSVLDGAKRKGSLMGPGRSEARAVGLLLLGGAGLVGLSLALPHPSGGDSVVLVATAAAMAVVGGLCFGLARIPVLATHAILALTIAATGVLIVASGVATGQYGAIFVWTMLVAGCYFRPRVIAAHLAWILTVYAVTLATVQSTAGYSPLTRWLFNAISLSVVAILTTTLVARRRQADLRARRFFDLSHDMLSTLDETGRCVEVNDAWEQCLGYTAEDMQGKRLLDLTHPDDREHAVSEAISAFKGTTSLSLEARVRARDGSWHWLRSSSALDAQEGLLYARSTDVTELKRVESEREALLEEVETLARSDSLTGLPNRRALDEQLALEMTRARRSEAPLCLAVLDLDRFKVFNDAHGHLAGDAMLRDCAAAWDSALRGGDMVARFGGEEFVVVLPGCTLDLAAEILERLRAATPGVQTCSAGLACWDLTESAEALLGRADGALYVAKEEGRDRLVRALPTES
jgi:diguanylate cyclase (GGDEF)-like protein/PAS domain S-box-containing protein